MNSIPNPSPDPCTGLSSEEVDMSRMSNTEIARTTVASLLKPGNVAEKLLTPWQREGLKIVQKRLDDTRAEETRHDIPNDLITLSAMAPQSHGIDYVMHTFAGTKNKKTSSPIEGQEEKLRLFGRFSNVSSFLKATSPSQITLDEMVDFVPPEWSCLSSESQQKLQKLLSWPSLSQWNFDIFEVAELSNGTPLLFLGWAILGSPYSQESMAASCGIDVELSREGYNFTVLFDIRQKTLCNYLRAVEGDYKSENPYHNNIHASDVVQTLHVFIQRGGKEFAEEIELFSILFAAVGHDVGHPGFTNSFQEHAGTQAALRYNDKSVLENMHASRTFLWLFGGEEGKLMNETAVKKKESAKNDMNILGGMRTEQIAAIRTLVIDAILKTDMTQHFTKMSRMKVLISEGLDIVPLPQ